MNDRPEWNYDVSMTCIETMMEYSITKVTHHWRMIGVDDSEDWAELHYEDPRGKNRTMRLPAHFNDYFEFRPNHRELFQPKPLAEQAYKTLNEIKAWKKRNQRDLSEYKRLKAKFEGV